MYQNLIKRVIDFTLALIATPFLLIILVIISPLIYFTDKGSVFFNAPRVGKNFKEFKMYKLRTMKVNAPDIRNPDGSTFNSDNDPRVTRVGKILRKTSIDELPQILNVLFGDMSFIGPRPILPGYNLNEFTDEMYKRMRIRPGITGYSQAYFRNSIPRIEKYINDAYYVDHVSFLFDIKILIKTFQTVLFRRNINTNSNIKNGS